MAQAHQPEETNIRNCVVVSTISVERISGRRSLLAIETDGWRVLNTFLGGDEGN